MKLGPHADPPWDPDSFRQVLSAHRAGTRVFLHWLLYSKSKIDLHKAPYPEGNQVKGLTKLASRSHNAAVLTDITSLHYSHFSEQQWETFAAFERKEKRKKKEKDEGNRGKKREKEVGKREEGRNLIHLKNPEFSHIWDTNHVSMARFCSPPSSAQKFSVSELSSDFMSINMDVFIDLHLCHLV